MVDDYSLKREKVVKTRFNKKFVFAALFFSDFLSFVLSFLIGGIIGYGVNFFFIDSNYEILGDVDQIFQRSIIFGVLSMSCLGWLASENQYDAECDIWGRFGICLKAIVFAFTIDVVIQYATQQSFSRLWLIGSWCAALAVLPTFFLLTRSILKSFGIWGRPTFILRSHKVQNSLTDVLNREWSGLYNCQIEINVSFSDYSSKGKDFKKLIDTVIERNGLFIFSVLPSEIIEIEKLCFELERRGVEFYLIPELGVAARRGLYQNMVFKNGIPFVYGNNRLMKTSSRIIKRTMDVLISSLLLVFLCIPMIITALIVRADGGAALFGHERVGFNGKLFKCLKFRSMYQNSDDLLADFLSTDAAARLEWEENCKLRHDPRVSRFGRFIRKTSIDELPQLINVLKGDMSLVGPRPVVRTELDMFYGDEGELYTSVMPGITGLWQVSGRSNTSYERRVDLDARYARNWSVFLDLKILLITPLTVCSFDGAY
ncbi:exopolysaccharide biosynthesis polyprenyl glycosylphosphotransferase [Thalassospira sp. NFXS8]|uniref:exopolysaccharide biosynthesis polyprenyl glycosylphosphotransferase n=1 Tax=Thalassospira sp. NFXS8 TaxID=2819093 RepID=UPI0032DEDA30